MGEKKAGEPFGKVELPGRCARRLNLESRSLPMNSCNGCYLSTSVDPGHPGPRGRPRLVLPYQATRIMLGDMPLQGQSSMGWSQNLASSSLRLLQEIVLLVTEYIFFICKIYVLHTMDDVHYI